MSDTEGTTPALVDHLDEYGDDTCRCGIAQVTAAQATLLKLFDEWYGDKSYRKHQEVAGWATKLTAPLLSAVASLTQERDEARAELNEMVARKARLQRDTDTTIADLREELATSAPQPKDAEPDCQGDCVWDGERYWCGGGHAPAAAVPSSGGQDTAADERCATCGKPIRWMDTVFNGGFWKHDGPPARDHDPEPATAGGTAADALTPMLHSGMLSPTVRQHVTEAIGTAPVPPRLTRSMTDAVGAQLATRRAAHTREAGGTASSEQGEVAP